MEKQRVKQEHNISRSVLFAWYNGSDILRETMRRAPLFHRPPFVNITNIRIDSSSLNQPVYANLIIVSKEYQNQRIVFLWLTEC